MQSLADFLVKTRFWLTLATVLASVGVLWGITHTYTDNSVRSILSEGDPYRAEVEEVRADFPPTASAIFAFETDTDVFTMEALEAMDALTLRYTEVDGAIAVGSLMNSRLNDVDAEKYDRDYLIPHLPEMTEADLAEVKAIALADEDLTKSILSPEGDMALANIKFQAPDDDQPRRLEIARTITDLRDDLREEFPNVQIYVLGGVLFELEGYNAQIEDRIYLMPLVTVVSIVLLWYCLKSLSFALCLWVLAFLTIGLTVGTYGWLDIPFNQISALGPLVVFVIAIADGIHVVSVYVQGLHRGLDRFTAMRESLVINIQPVTLATITTGMGFLCLNYSSSPGIYGFGNIVAIGVVWAFILTFTLLPALVLWLPTHKIPKELGVQSFIAYTRNLVETRGKELLVGGGILILITLALLPLNRLDFNRFTFVDDDSDFHHVITALAEKIGNDQALVYGIHSGAYYGITEPEFLAEVDKFTTWLEAQPEASFVSSYTDYLKTRNKEENDDDEAYEVIPDDKLQVIDYLVGYQLFQEIEPNLSTIFNADYSAIRLIVGTSNLSNKELLAFADRIEAWKEANFDKRYRVLHGDNSILFARLDRGIAVELAKGFSLSFVLITLTLLIGLRSWRYGLISIGPNVFPATIVFGFWGLFVGELSPYILMLFSISIGLVVDDSVHVLSKYISARKEGKTPEDAVRYSLDKAGSAITITTISIAIGTFILIFSNTFHFQNVALLLTPIILVAWLLDLYCLPPLLVRYDRWRDKLGPAVTKESEAPA